MTKENRAPVEKENGTKMHPFSAHEPLFRALNICSPDFDLDTVDIVTDRDSLRKLLRFCDSPGSRWALIYVQRACLVTGSARYKNNLISPRRQ